MIFEKTVGPPLLVSVASDVHAWCARAVHRAQGRAGGPDITIRGLYGKLACDFTPTSRALARHRRRGRSRRRPQERDRSARARRVRGTIDVDGRRFDLEGGTGGWDHHERAHAATHEVAVGLRARTRRRLQPRRRLRGRGGVRALHARRRRAARRAALCVRSRASRRAVDDHGEGIDLRFEVGAVHAQNTNLVVVRSRFLQPVGTFHGTIGGQDVDGLPGWSRTRTSSGSSRPGLGASVEEEYRRDRDRGDDEGADGFCMVLLLRTLEPEDL